MKKFIVSLTTFFITIALIVLQISLLNNLPLFNVIANIGIVFIILISIKSNENIGGAVGILFGVLVDLFYGMTFGKHVLLYFLVGYGCGKLKRKIDIDNNLSVLVLVIITTSIYEFINMILIFLQFKQVSYDILYILKIITLESIYNIFLAYVFFIPFSSWGEVLNRTRKGYYL